jgi:hypothetical protein
MVSDAYGDVEQKAREQFDKLTVTLVQLLSDLILVGFWKQGYGSIRLG